MNKVLLVGRLTKDPEVKATSSQVKVCNFTVAVDRRYKDANGQKQADFINCVAWRQTAEFIGKYFSKGQRIGLVGSIQTRTYDDNNGQRHYVTEVLIDEAEFVDSANSGGRQSNEYQNQTPPPQQAPAQQQVQQNTVASTAPTAPQTSIGDDSGDEFGSGDSMDLPFEI